MAAWDTDAPARTGTAASGVAEVECHFSFKVCVLGDSGVGKTMLVQGSRGAGGGKVGHGSRHGSRRSSRGGGKAEEDEEETGAALGSHQAGGSGVHVRVKVYSVDGQSCRVEVWDLPGAERHLSLAPHYCCAAAAAMLVFDVTDEESFTNVKRWLDVVPASVGTRVLVANKVKHPKRERVVLRAEGEDLAGSNGMQYVEIDALTGFNVADALSTTIREVVQRIPDPPEPSLLLKTGVTIGRKLMSSETYKRSLFPALPGADE